MIMQSLIRSIAQRMGAALRYFFMRIVCRRKNVSYKILSYDKKATALANFDNAFGDGCLGIIVFVILILLMIKYLG